MLRLSYHLRRQRCLQNRAEILTKKFQLRAQMNLKLFLVGDFLCLLLELVPHQIVVFLDLLKQSLHFFKLLIDLAHAMFVLCKAVLMQLFPHLDLMVVFFDLLKNPLFFVKLAPILKGSKRRPWS